MKVDCNIENHELKDMLSFFSQKNDGFKVDNFLNLCSDTDEQTAIKILSYFYVSLIDATSQIQLAVEIENKEFLWKTAHKLAGSSELLGFKLFADKSRSLSHKIRNNEAEGFNKTEAQQYLNTVSALCSDIRDRFPSLMAHL